MVLQMRLIYMEVSWSLTNALTAEIEELSADRNKVGKIRLSYGECLDGEKDKIFHRSIPIKSIYIMVDCMHKMLQ